MFFIVFAVAVFVMPGLTVNFKLLTIWQLCVLPALVGLMALIVWHARLGNTDARKMLAGSLILVMMSLVDIISDLYLMRVPSLLPVGFAAFFYRCR